MGYSPYDSGGPIRVGENQENDSYDSGDGIVEVMQNYLYSGDNSSDSYDISEWDSLMASIDNMSANELIAWIGKHPSIAKANASVLDSMIQQKYNRENYDYEYEKNRQMQLDEREYNSMKNVMARLKEAGVNPTLAFRTGENPVSFSNPSHGRVNSNLASQFAKEASLAESSRKTDFSAIFSTISAIAGFVGLMIALL